MTQSLSSSNNNLRDYPCNAKCTKAFTKIQYFFIHSIKSTKEIQTFHKRYSLLNAPKLEIIESTNSLFFSSLCDTGLENKKTLTIWSLVYKNCVVYRQENGIRGMYALYRRDVAALTNVLIPSHFLPARHFLRFYWLYVCCLVAWW